MRCGAFFVALLLTPIPAAAQETQAGQTAEISTGQVGQRQRTDEAAPNIEPMRRIGNRIQNRVQSRIRNRIDRYYDPQANAASPFEVAGDEARRADKPRRP